MQDINIVGYDPKNLISYLTNKIDEDIHNISKLNGIKFKITFNSITTHKIFFSFTFLYKRKVDIESKNRLILDTKDMIYNILNEIFEYGYEGLNGFYNFNSFLLYSEGKEVILSVNYKKVGIAYYTSIVPQELILIIIDKVSKDSLTSLYKSGIISNFSSIDSNYKVLVSMYDRRVFSDILEFNSIFGKFKENWRDIYLNIRQLAIKDLYLNRREDGTIISENNWSSINFINDAWTSDNNNLSSVKNKYIGLLFSFRLKVVMPNWYKTLLTFFLNYNSTIDELLMGMFAIYKLIRYATSLIRSIIEGYRAIRLFPIKSKGEDSIHSNKMKYLIFSPIVLWYFLNTDNVVFDNILDISLDIKQTKGVINSSKVLVYYAILNSLNIKFKPEEYMRKVGNALLVFLYKTSTTYKIDKYYKKEYNADHLNSEIFKEIKRRNLSIYNIIN